VPSVDRLSLTVSGLGKGDAGIAADRSGSQAPKEEGLTSDGRQRTLAARGRSRELSPSEREISPGRSL